MMVKYRISRVRMVIRCGYYNGLYNDVYHIICRNIIKELNVDIADFLFHKDPTIKYNPFEKILVYQNTYMDIAIDEKVHHKIILLNPDYTSRKMNIGDIRRKFRIYRYDSSFSNRFRNHFSFIVNESE